MSLRTSGVMTCTLDGSGSPSKRGAHFSSAQKTLVPAPVPFGMVTSRAATSWLRRPRWALNFPVTPSTSLPSSRNSRVEPSVMQMRVRFTVLMDMVLS